MKMRALWAGMLAALAMASRAEAQAAAARGLRVEAAGVADVIPLVVDHGYAAVPASVLERWGWSLVETAKELRAVYRGDTLGLESGSPFVSWQGELYQLAEAPYVREGALHVPVQLLADWLPAALGGSFTFDPEERVLRGPAATAEAAAPVTGVARARETYTARHSRLVVIDPGHGGEDPGAVGRLGTREKELALRLALELARALERDSTVEVRLTRDRDVLVPLWQRGEVATRWRAGRPAVFVSLHANSLPRSRAVRGFETYFLSEARTEHERRVAAIENAPLQREGEGASGSDGALAFILKELVKLDHQHWSALLAEMVQRHLARVHPGPNRGVKQAPLAVVTNALMPAVLVEVGFVSNRAEESLLRDRGFQRESADAVAAAIREFFRRYPPGQGVRTEGS